MTQPDSGVHLHGLVRASQRTDIHYLLLSVIPSEAEGSAVCVGLREPTVDQRNHHYYVYIVASRTRVLYCGMTNNLRRRVAQHKESTVPGFTDSYNCNRLVWFERYQYVKSAIAREKQIKGWTRVKKLSLIGEMNPSWADLSEQWDS